MAEIISVTAATATERTEAWRNVYNARFTGPPWNEPPKARDVYAAHLARHLAYPGFAAREAHTLRDELDELVGVVGVAYGWPTPTDLRHPFHQALIRGLPSASELLTSDAFEIAELMVLPTHRSHGIGRLLLDDLRRDHTRSWLATLPNSSAARFYTRLGWTSHGTFVADHQRWQVYEHHTE